MTARPMTEVEREAERWIKQCEGVEEYLSMRERKILGFARALLSTSSAVRGMREALEETLLHLETFHSLLPKGDARKIIWRALKDGRAALSLVEGEDKQARSPSALSAPTTTDTKDTTNA